MKIPGCPIRPMSLDEAIAHADEVAGDCSTGCKREHKQLADWLRELKSRRSAGCGDAAKLREAASYLTSIFDCDIQFLERHAKELRDTGAYGGGIIEHILHSITLARAALATPPRNFERFQTKDAAREAFQKLRGHRVMADVSLWDDRDEIEAFLDWLFGLGKEGGAK